MYQFSVYLYFYDRDTYGFKKLFELASRIKWEKKKIQKKKSMETFPLLFRLYR